MFPEDSSEWSDIDGDGVGDNLDYNPYDPEIETIQDTIDKAKSEDGQTSSNQLILLLGIILVILLTIILILLVIITRGKTDSVSSRMLNSAIIEDSLFEEIESKPQTTPDISMMSNAGIKGDYEWLNFNGVMYYRRIGHVVEWVAWEAPKNG